MESNVPVALPFAVEEFEARQGRVRAELERRGIDALFVSNPANILYLTGYVASWYSPRLPVGVGISRSSTEIVFFDWSRHREYVRQTALYDTTALFEYSDAAQVVADAFRERGWTDGTVAIEWQALNPVAGVLNGVAASLRAAGAEVVDDDWLVDTIRLYKSPAEVEKVRVAAGMLDAAFTQLWHDLRPGMTEIQVAARVLTLLADQGSEMPASPPLVSSGPTAWADTHAAPSNRVLERGDVVSLDTCAVVDRYHVNLSRTWSLGEPNALARRLLADAEPGLDVLIEHARLGDGPETAMTAAEQVVRAKISPDRVWWIGGYSFGIALPPSWVGHGYLANDGPTKVTWQPGYLSNFEIVLFDREEGFAADAIDTVLMTEDGLQALSELPRGLLDAQG
jgi:Xaa-Pro aminopeptidase